MNDFKNIKKLNPDRLLELAREFLDQSENFEYIEGVQPFFISFRNKKYYVYIKNISSAYFSDRDKTTRAQLPIKSEFDSIKSTPFPFIFLGYDGKNDVYVCWNFHVVKERLNVAKSVSFYSRTFFQSQVKPGQIIRVLLKNGDRPVLFKRCDIVSFFNRIETFFVNEKASVEKESAVSNNANLLVPFKTFLAEEKRLSEKTIKNYSNALSGRISEGIRKYIDPNVKNIFNFDDIDYLSRIKEELFSTQEFKKLDIKGKKMYSCAFNNYLDFIILVKDTSDEKSVGPSFTAPAVSDQKNQSKKLNFISDPVILEEIKPLLESNRILSAAQKVGEYYDGLYPDMDLKDWMQLINKTKGQIN